MNPDMTNHQVDIDLVANSHMPACASQTCAREVGEACYLAGDEALNAVFDDLGVGLEKFHELL